MSGEEADWYSRKWSLPGGLGLSPISSGSSLFWASVSPSIKWVMVKREVGLIVLKLVVFSLIPCFLPPLSGAPWLLWVCYEVSSSYRLPSPQPVL